MAMKRVTERGSLLYNRFLQATSRRWYVLIPLFVALPLVLKFLVFENASIIGNDTQTQIYKAIILQRSIEQMPFYLWGKWDWNWYAGYPFLQVYGPLFYYLMAIISSVFNVSIDLTARLVLPFFFFLSALSMYLLCIHLTKDKLASILGAAAYAYSPYLISDFSTDGSVGSFMAFAFAPLALLFADRLSNDGNNVDAFLSAAFIGLTLLSNQATGLLLLMVVLLFLLLQKKILSGIKVVVETFLVTAFWVLPYATNLQSAFLPVTSSRSPLMIFGLLLTKYFGLVPIVLLVMAVWLVKRKLIKNTKIFTLCAILALFTTYNIIIFFFPLPIFSALALGRTSALYVFLVPPLAALALTFGNKLSRKGVIVIIFLVLLIIEGLFVQVYVPLTVERYTNAYSFLTTDDTWFRVLQLPREPVGSLIPIVSNKPVIDGWYDQGSSLSTLIANVSMNMWFSGSPTTPTWTSDPRKAIAALGYLGVKYIIVDKADPIFGSEFSQALYRAINSTENVTEVFTSADLTVLRLDTFQNLTLATSVVPVNNLTEFIDYLPYRQNMSEAIVYNGQEFLLPLGARGTPNYKILSINQTCQSMNYKFYVDRPALLILPLDYDKSLQVSINGTRVPFYKVPPGIIGIPLGNAGMYVIVVEPVATFLQLIAYSISATWIIAFIAITGAEAVKKRLRVKKENAMRGTCNFCYNMDRLDSCASKG